MPDLVLVVPFALEATLRFVRKASGVPGLRLGIVTQQAAEKLPEDVRAAAAGFARVHDALDPEQVADGVRKIARSWGGNVDRIAGVLEQLQVPLAEVRERLGIPGMGVAAAKNFRDKSRMKDVLRANDLPCARHALVETAEQALAFADEVGFPLVCKPQAGAGAKNTFRVEERTALVGYLRRWPLHRGEQMLLEEFIIGEEFSFDTVTVNGRHVLHSVTRYYPTPLEVMETPWIQWCVVLPRRIDGGEFDDILEAGPKALDVLGMDTGITHMEWFRRRGGRIAISEVAARPPGAQFTTLLSYAYDHDFYAAWVRLVAGLGFEVPERRWAVGAAFLRGQGAGKVVAVHGLDDAQRELGKLVVEAEVPEPGRPQASSYEGEGYVILRDADTEVVTRGLARLVRLIRVELGQEGR